MERAALKLTERDSAGNVRVWGVDMFLWQWPFMNFFAQAGGKQWSADGLTTLIDSPAGVEALEFMRKLAYEDRVWQPYFGRDQGTGPDTKFASGQVAMYYDGSWMVPNFELRAPGLEFAVAPVPRGKERAILCGSTLWAVSSHAARKELGWEMISWLTTPEQALQYWDTLRVALPASISAVGSASFRSTRGIPRASEPGVFDVPPMPEGRFKGRAEWLLAAYTPDPETGKAPGFVPVGLYQRPLEEEINRMLQDYLAPGSTLSAAEALRRVARNVHQVIDRDRAARGLTAVER
jgi:ABC-type glycerol-3-phosphate transport system substrate-binding protein